MLTERTLDDAFVEELPPRIIGDKAWDGSALQARLLEERGIDLILPTGTPCATDGECSAGALCFEVASEAATQGECQILNGECQPVGATQEGAPFGSTCTIGDGTCAGSCVLVGASNPGSSAATAGECEETCRVGGVSGCGQTKLQGSGVACAFFAFDLSDAGITQGAGDIGVCATLCDCNAECPGDQLCLNNPTDGFLGVCAGGLNNGDTLTTCAPDGVGGAGGSGAP